MSLFRSTCFVLVFVLVQCSIAEGKKKSKNSRFVWKRPDYVMPWLRGPNVCALEEVMGSRRRYFSECRTYRNRQICGKNTFVRYHCCTGFEVEEGLEGCQGVAPVESLMETTKHLYLKDFRKHAQTIDTVAHRLKHGGAYTVFAPENKAFNNLPQNINSKFNEKDPDKNLLSYHMVNDRYYEDDLTNDMTISTLHTENSHNTTVRINRYSNGIVTVNCARLILPNQLATNGIVHVIENVIHPMDSSATSVMELVLFDGNLGEFVTALVLTDLSNDLRASAGSYTIFAPSDEAFRNAPPELISRVLKDNRLVEKLLRYHILDKSICASAVLGPASVKTLEGQKVNLSCDINDRMTINNIPLSASNNMAENGIVHTIDTLLIPDSVKTLGEKANELGLFEFVEYAQQAGIHRNIMNQMATNYTLLIPSQEAFANLTYEQKRILRSSNQAVERVFNYHVLPGHVSTKQMIGDAILNTYSSSSTVNAYSNTKVYTKAFGVNSARIIEGDHTVSNGIIHVTDQVLWPPEGVLMDRIQEDPTLKTFMSLLQTAGLDELLLQEDHQYTIFAPTDDAFDAMQTSVLEDLMINMENLEMFLQNHIIKSPTYLRTLEDKWRYRFKTIQGEWIEIKRRSRGEREFINEIIEVVQSDKQATNGVLHKVNTVFSCSCLESFSNEVPLR